MKKTQFVKMNLYRLELILICCVC